MQCPCDIKKRYNECCEPYHKGKKASQADVLMRSRYSAFVLGLSSYIFETETAALHQDITLEAFDQAIKQQKWIGLDLIDSSDTEAEFKAHLLDGGRWIVHHERSLFLTEEGRLKYAKALTMQSSEQKVLRNDLCPCGSNKKFKKCKHD